MATVRERAVASALAGSPRREHGTAREWRCDSTRGARARPRDHAADFTQCAQPVPNARVPRPKAQCPRPSAQCPICPMPICRSGSGRQLLQARRRLCSRRRRLCRRRSAGSGGRRGRRSGAAYRNGGEERRSSSSSSSRLVLSAAWQQDARAPGGCDAAACVEARTRASISARAVGRCPTHDLP